MNENHVDENMMNKIMAQFVFDIRDPYILRYLSLYQQKYKTSY